MTSPCTRRPSPRSSPRWAWRGGGWRRPGSWPSSRRASGPPSAAATAGGGRGALLVAYMSQASTKICAGVPGTIVSYGYDRIRFPNPVFFGDTVTVTYEIAERDVAAKKTFGRVTCTNQRGEVVAAATHILKVVEG